MAGRRWTNSSSALRACSTSPTVRTPRDPPRAGQYRLWQPEGHVSEHKELLPGHGWVRVRARATDSRWPAGFRSLAAPTDAGDTHHQILGGQRLRPFRAGPLASAQLIEGWGHLRPRPRSRCGRVGRRDRTPRRRPASIRWVGRCCLDRLCGASHPLADPPHAALDRMADTQLKPDLPDVDRVSFKRKGPIAGDDVEVADAGQRRGELFDRLTG